MTRFEQFLMRANDDMVNSDPIQPSYENQVKNTYCDISGLPPAKGLII